MKVSSTATKTTIIGAIVTSGFLGMVGTPTASADQAAIAGAHGFGTQATIVNGDVVQGWTVSDLRPSTDTIPYPVRGTLWEATATDEAIKGSVIPIVSNLAARTTGDQTYPVLFQVATPQGVNPAALIQGQKTTGKLYFDVTGDRPIGVVYDAGAQDLVSWVESSSPQRRLGGATTTSSPSGSATTPTPAVAPVSVGGQQTPVVKSAAPAPASSQPAPVTGSQGLPMPANNPPPAPAGGPTTPTPEAPPAPTGPTDSQGSAGNPATPAH